MKCTFQIAKCIFRDAKQRNLTDVFTFSIVHSRFSTIVQTNFQLHCRFAPNYSIIEPLSVIRTVVFCGNLRNCLIRILLLIVFSNDRLGLNGIHISIIIHTKDDKMLKNDLKTLLFVRYFVRYIFRYKYTLSILILNKLQNVQTTNTIKVLFPH